MLRSVRFESIDPPVQEVESDTSKVPFDIVDPPGDVINARIPTPFKVKVTRANRASRTMQYVWWGEVVPGTEGARVLGVGSFGNFTLPEGSDEGTGFHPEPAAARHQRKRQSVRTG